jgi:glycosyltransferase involved in cell wall biosynthesis
MRILMPSYEFPPLGGGGAAVVHGLSTQLVRLGHEVDVVTMHRVGLPRREEVEGVQVHRVPCVRLNASHCSMPEQATYLAAALPYVLRLARRRQYDVNHTHFILPDGVLSMVLRRVTGLPYVITSHGSDVPGYNPHRFRLAHRALAPVWRAVVERSGGIISPSETLEGLVLEAKPDARTVVIPNGITVGPPRQATTRESKILVVTRMLERKGVQYVLEALAGGMFGHEVEIVGDGPYLPTLERLAEELAVPVRFHGWLDRSSPELKRLYETSQIYVFPSEAENFPIVLLEAMRAGTAIITTAGTGCAEVVGDTALLVPPRDPAAIREALSRLTADPELCRQLGEAARARLEENFTWRAIARRHTAYYAAHRRHRPQVPAPAVRQGAGT